MAKCPVCGAPMEKETCGYCGYVEKKEEQVAGTTQQVIHTHVVQPQVVITGQPIVNGIVMTESNKSRLVTLLLCIFLGSFGVHKFYVGKVGMGILYLFTAGLFGIGWFVDFILILVGSAKDKHGLPIKKW